MKNENSLIEAAVLLLQAEKKPYDFYQLFDLITASKGFSEEEKTKVITMFYTDLTTSAKFVYTGDNQWDLKVNQKIELWEKDGSFFKEYTKVDLPDELKPVKAVKAKKATKAKKAKKVVAPVIVIQEAKVVEEPVVEAVVEPVVEAVVEPAVKKVAPKSTDKDAVVENYEEEVFEEFEEFDEDKYNEYMDTYEDQYKDKK